MEDNMNEEMTGMAAPDPEMDATEMNDPMDTVPPEAVDESENPEKTSSFKMETMISNYMDLDEQSKERLKVILGTQIKDVIDQVIGEPVLERLTLQIGEMGAAAKGAESSAPAPEGMMAPSTEPMAEMPMEEEEATPPV